MSKHHLITGDNGNGASTSQALTIRHTAAAPAFAPVTSEITARGSAYSIYRSDPDIQDSRIGTHTFLSSIDLGVIGGGVNTGDRPGRIGGDAITIILLREGGSAHITGTIRNLPAAGDQTDYRIYAIRDGDFWFLYAHNSITRPNPKLGEEFVFLFTLSETGGESDSRYRIYHTEKVEDGRSFDLISDQVTLVEVADTPGVTVFTDPEGVFRAANPGDSTAAASYDVALGTTSAQAVEASDGVGDAFTHKITDSVTANGQTTTYGTLFYNAGTGAWRFDTDDTGASSLESGDTRTITFAVTASTGGSTARHELVVNITGVDEISNHDDAPTFAPATSLITDPASLYIYRSEVDQSGRDDVPMHTFMVSAALEDGAVADEAITIFLLREGVGSAIPITGMISGLPSTGDENDYRIWAVRDGSAWSLHANAITPDPPRPGADEHIFLFTLSETGSASDPVYQLYNTSRVESPDNADAITLRTSAISIVQIADTPADDDFTDADAFPGLSGQFDARDPNGDALTYSVAMGESRAVTDDTSRTADGFTHKITTDYGVLWFSTGGAWDFIVNDPATEALTQGESHRLPFAVTATAGGKTATQALVVTLSGDNDPPALTASSLDANYDITNLARSVSGELDFTDDQESGHVFSVLGREETSLEYTRTFGSSLDTFNVRHGEVTYGILSLDTDRGVWSFTADPGALGGISAGETIVLSLKVVVADDGTPPLSSNILPFTITLNGAAAPPPPPPLPDSLDVSVHLNPDEVIVLSGGDFGSTDATPLPEVTVYALTALGSSIMVEKSINGTWTPLTTTAGSNSFTQADIDAGHIRISATASGTLGVNIHIGAQTVTGTVTITVREEYTPPAGQTEALTEVDLAAKIAPQHVVTGVGQTEIKTGAGDDEVDPGLGDDRVDLSAGGDDQVVYRFDVTADGRFVAWDGGDVITGFNPDDDMLILSSLDDGADAVATLEAFTARLGTGFKAALDFTYREDHTPDGGARELADYDVTGVEIHFMGAVLLPGGRLPGSVLVIEFDSPISWTPFKEKFLPGDAFNEAGLVFRSTESGQIALGNILGLDVEHGSESRHVAIGDGGGNEFSLAGRSGGWVVDPGGGDDTVTLGGGIEEVVYRLADDGTSLTPGDGSDTINAFTLGVDRLTFVDSAGTAPDIASLIMRMSNITLSYDGTNYTGISFTMMDESLVVNFAAALSPAVLKAGLGISDDAAFNAALNAAFIGGAPTGASDVTLTPAGLGYVDELFDGADDDVMYLGVSTTLPAELL